MPLVHADALMDRAPMDDEELGFSVNDVIAVLDMTDDDWWRGMLDDKIGWFPASWVRVSGCPGRQCCQYVFVCIGVGFSGTVKTENCLTLVSVLNNKQSLLCIHLVLYAMGKTKSNLFIVSSC